MRAPEQLGPYRYEQSDTCFPLGQDSLALAAFATLRRGDRVCDLGCGAGALLLLLAARQSTLTLSGVEISPADSALTRKNLAENGLTGEIYTGDLRQVCKTLPAGGFSLVISNPPYFKSGSGGDGGGARMEEATLTDWCAAAGRLVKNGGRFALVHRPERLAELFAALRRTAGEKRRAVCSGPPAGTAGGALCRPAGRRPGAQAAPTDPA